MASKKKPAKKVAAKKAAIKKVAKKVVAKKKTVAKAAKKAVTKKAVSKKSALKKAAPKKATAKKAIAKKAVKKATPPKKVSKKKPRGKPKDIVVIPQPEAMPPAPITNAEIETGIEGDDIIIIPHPTREIPMIPHPEPEEGIACICRKIGAFFFCMKQLPNGSLIQCDGPFETLEECQTHRCLT